MTLSILGATARAYCYNAEVIDLSSRKYLPAVKEALSKAKESIYMVMYFVSFDPNSKQSPVNDLVTEIVNAHKRGVKVKVILDQNINFADWEREGKNDVFFAYLKKQGIEVYYENIYVVTHSKAIIIDGETVILGSANWTESSLRRNQESSCLIRSKELAKEFLQDFSQIIIDYQASVLPEERQPPVRLGDYFLTVPSLGPRMVTARDETAFDLYLLLLRNYDGNPEGRVEIDYKNISSIFGLDKKFSYETAYYILEQALVRLDKRYNLIRRITRYHKGPCCLLLNYPGKEPYILPQDRYCAIPDEYWQYGWNKKLSFPEKYFYLINLRKSATSPGRIWVSYQGRIIDEFHLSSQTIFRGTIGLRKLNILEVEYPDYPEGGGYAHRSPMRFKLLGLYSPETLQKEKERLNKLYGKKRFEQAQKYAEIVFKGNDIQVIDDIIQKIDEYGDKEVGEAFAKVSSRSSGNPKRSYKYVVGILNAEH